MLVAIETAKLKQLMQMGIQIDPNEFNPETDETRREGGGFSPEILPNAGQGIPSPIPGIDTPFQTGPVVAPNTPRPGARTNGFASLSDRGLG